jgi:hypothetical protein
MPVICTSNDILVQIISSRNNGGGSMMAMMVMVSEVVRWQRFDNDGGDDNDRIHEYKGLIIWEWWKKIYAYVDQDFRSFQTLENMEKQTKR